ncbi:MAG: hypothetical protein NTV71_01675 [Candidatus Omnitrophica bacterium]|nr:hypothetical protein [Candidatus Omnitrophota bacterium]
MSAKVKVMMIAFISFVSIATWSFAAEEIQSQTTDAGKVVKSEAKVVKTKTKATKVRKEKSHVKAKKVKKDTKVNK